MLEKIDNRRRQAARLRVLGHKSADIARQLGVHKTTITRWSQSEAFKREVNKLSEIADNSFMSPAANDTQIRLIEIAATAVDVLGDILKDERSDVQMMKLKMGVAVEVLSRAGFSPIQRVDVKKQSVSATVSSEQIAELKRRLETVKLNS